MKFRQKLLLAMVWLLSFSCGIGGTLLIRQSFRDSLAQAKKNAAAAYEMTLQTVQLVNLVDIQQDFSSIRTALERMEAADQLGICLTQKGDTVYQRGLQPRPLSPGDSCLSILYARQDQHILQLSAGVPTNTEALQLDILYDVSAVYEARQAQLRSFRLVFLLQLLLCGAAAWLIAWLMTKPLSALTFAAKKLGAGKLDARVTRLPRDEVGILGAAFNQMADQLSDKISQQREAMERQERFMGSFAHELKTPMTSVIGYADLLRSQSLNQEEAREAANYIFSEGKRLEALSLKLLDLLLVKQEQLSLRPIPVGPLIEGLVARLQPIYRQQGIRLQCRCAEGICPLDADLFQSVLVNLLDNARKAIQGDGNIYVLGQAAQGQYWIRVLDNGRGIPEEALRHLSEAFYRVDKARSRAQGGAGLGLTLCSRILELHGGQISFASREGNGTCVTICLPEVTT